MTSFWLSGVGGRSCLCGRLVGRWGWRVIRGHLNGLIAVRMGRVRGGRGLIVIGGLLSVSGLRWLIVCRWGLLSISGLRWSLVCGGFRGVSSGRSSGISSGGSSVSRTSRIGLTRITCRHFVILAGHGFPNLLVVTRLARVRSCRISLSGLVRMTGPSAGISLVCRRWIGLVSGVSLRRVGRLTVLRLLLVCSLNILGRLLVSSLIILRLRLVSGLRLLVSSLPVLSRLLSTVPAKEGISEAATESTVETMASVPTIAVATPVPAITSIVRVAVSTVVPRVEAGPVVVVSVVEEAVVTFLAVALAMLPSVALVVVVVVLVVVVIPLVLVNVTLVVPLMVTESLVEAAEVTLPVVMGRVKGVTVVVVQGQERREVLALEPVMMAQPKTVAVPVTTISVAAVSSIAVSFSVRWIV